MFFLESIQHLLPTTYIQETSAFISVSNILNYSFQLKRYVVMYLTVAIYGEKYNEY